MPEEDDDALEKVLEGRLNRDSDTDQQRRETNETNGSEADSDTDGQSDSVTAGSSDTDTETDSASTSNATVDGDSEQRSVEDSAQPMHSTETTQSTQITQPTDSTDRTGGVDEEVATAQSESSAADAVRSRSPLPLYLTPGLKTTVQTRFEKFNAQRTLNDEPQVQKHKHFMEGLLNAGLDHPELERYVLDEFESE